MFHIIHEIQLNKTWNSDLEISGYPQSLTYTEQVWSTSEPRSTPQLETAVALQSRGGHGGRGTTHHSRQRASTGTDSWGWAWVVEKLICSQLTAPRPGMLKSWVSSLDFTLFVQAVRWPKDSLYSFQTKEKKSLSWQVQLEVIKRDGS